VQLVIIVITGVLMLVIVQVELMQILQQWPVKIVNFHVLLAHQVPLIVLHAKQASYTTAICVLIVAHLECTNQLFIALIVLDHVLLVLAHLFVLLVLHYF
jgi:hypothetical protein